MMNSPVKTIFFGHDQQEKSDPRKNYLELAGYKVRAFSNAQSMLAAFKEEMPTCVIMDVLLEGKNGFEVAEELRRKVPKRPFPMVLCSRLYRGRVFREEARRRGVSSYLLMPMSLEDFLKNVNTAIQQYKPPSGQLELAA